MAKIDILGLHLNYGGTEQSIINQANMLCDNFDVRLVITYKLSPKPAFKLDKRVKVIYLTHLKPNRETFQKAIQNKNILKIFSEGLLAIKTLITKTKTMKRYIKTSDANIIISSRLDFHKLVSKHAKKTTIKIAEEHRYSLNDAKYLRKIKKSCNNFNYFVCVSQILTNNYQVLLPNVKCVFIPNALLSNASNRIIANYNTNNILSVGRLSKEKGFDDAIRIIDILAKEIPDIKLNIIGEGPERHHLETQINARNLDNHIILHGFQNQAYIKQTAAHSSLYLLTSHEESFGTVIIEAASFGLPTIAFDSAKGPLEIIHNNKNGILIDNRDLGKAAKTILQLFNDRKTLAALGKNAFLDSKQYSFDSIKNLWTNLMSTALEKKVYPL